jgi:hypothetical protein
MPHRNIRVNSDSCRDNTLSLFSGKLTLKESRSAEDRRGNPEAQLDGFDPRSSKNAVEINNATNSFHALARWGGVNLVASSRTIPHPVASQQLSQVIPDRDLSILNKLTVVSRIVVSTEPPPYVMVQKMTF